MPQLTDFRRLAVLVAAAIATLILQDGCARKNAPQSTDAEVTGIARNVDQPTKPDEAKTSLVLQLVDLKGQPAERQSIAMTPVTEGYSPEIDRFQFWADRSGRIMVDSITPGRHRFVLNPGSPVPTFVDVTVPAGGLTRRWTIPRRKGVKSDLNVDIELLTKEGPGDPGEVECQSVEQHGPSLHIRCNRPLVARA